MPSAMRFFGLLLMLWLIGMAWMFADDDDLPNFNAPVDNTPLNVDKVNRIMGLPLFKEPSLWNEDSPVVAGRVGWPQESRTSTQSSYRLYPTQEKPVTILGARAYSCVLYATKDNPTEVSIVFVNEGDYGWTQKYLAGAKELHAKAAPMDPTNDAPTDAEKDVDSLRKTDPDDYSRIDHDVHEAFEKALKHDADTITDALTKLFGEPQHMGFGGGSETRERVLRWDWQGHAFLLSTPKDVYVTLRIVPVAFADNYGKGDVIDRDELKSELAQRVKKFDNGDVVVTDIPIVDQGPKGYCVPATWERYLRYMGIPADMYVLAMAAGSSQDGTYVGAMVGNVDSLVTLYHRRIDDVPGDFDMKTIEQNIDRGLPLMWSCDIHIPLEKRLSERMAERAAVTDWDAWGAKLKDVDAREVLKEIHDSPSAGGHQRMIIGYNEKTGEIAISDSWSKFFALRWMTLAEANAINQGQLYVIEP
jgi:hypothetical protein